jgi:hypothetical protein
VFGNNTHTKLDLVAAGSLVALIKLEAVIVQDEFISSINSKQVGRRDIITVIESTEKDAVSMNGNVAGFEDDQLALHRSNVTRKPCRLEKLRS